MMMCIKYWPGWWYADICLLSISTTVKTGTKDRYSWNPNFSPQEQHASSIVKHISCVIGFKTIHIVSVSISMGIKKESKQIIKKDQIFHARTWQWLTPLEGSIWRDLTNKSSSATVTNWQLPRNLWVGPIKPWGQDKSVLPMFFHLFKTLLGHYQRKPWVKYCNRSLHISGQRDKSSHTKRAGCDLCCCNFFCFPDELLNCIFTATSLKV